MTADRLRRAGLALLSVALLVAAARFAAGLELAPILASLSSANPLLVAAAAAAYFAGFVLRGRRWSDLLAGSGVSLGGLRAARAILLANALNSLLPGRAGDAARPTLAIGRGELAVGYGTMVVERICDLAFVLIGVMALGLVSLGPRLPGEILLACVAAGGLVLLAVGVLAAAERTGTHLADHLPQRLAGALHAFGRALRSVRPSAAPRLASLTAGLWVLEVARLTLIVAALGLSSELSLADCAFLALTAALLSGVPLTPAGVGVVEAGLYGLLTAGFGIAAAPAAALVALDRMVSTLLLVIVAAGVWLAGRLLYSRPARLPAGREMQQP